MERVNEILNSNKISIALSLVGVVLIIGGIYFSKTTQAKTPTPTAYPKESLVQGVSTSGEIKVDISGAVLSPGVYSFPIETRVEDVVKKAGGFTENANGNFISKTLNLSQKISDGSKIYIPFKGENSGGVSGGNTVVGSTAAAGNMNINTADAKDLDALPGIGPVTAQKIIDARPYTDPLQLIDKKVVSKSVYEKIKGQISI